MNIVFCVDCCFLVIVLFGFFGVGKIILFNQILCNCEGLCVVVIVNDMSEVNIDVQLLCEGGVELYCIEEMLVEFSNGCICCMLCDDLLQEVWCLVDVGCYDYLLIELMGIGELMLVVVIFVVCDEQGFSLSDIVCLDMMVMVVDGSVFFVDFGLMLCFVECGQQVGLDDDCGVVDLLCEQVEFVDVIVVSKVDQIDDEVLQDMLVVLCGLNCDVKLLLLCFGDVLLVELLDIGCFDYECV